MSLWPCYTLLCCKCLVGCFRKPHIRTITPLTTKRNSQGSETLFNKNSDTRIFSTSIALLLLTYPIAATSQALSCYPTSCQRHPKFTNLTTPNLSYANMTSSMIATAAYECGLIGSLVDKFNFWRDTVSEILRTLGLIKLLAVA